MVKGGKDTVARHLRSRGEITPMQALVTYGIYRLAARIHDLRNEGWPIETEMKQDEAGHKYARYFIKSKSRRI